MNDGCFGVEVLFWINWKELPRRGCVNNPIRSELKEEWGKALQSKKQSHNCPILPLAQPSPVRLNVEAGNLILWEAKQMFWKNKPLRTRTHRRTNLLSVKMAASRGASSREPTNSGQFCDSETAAADIVNLGRGEWSRGPCFCQPWRIQAAARRRDHTRPFGSRWKHVQGAGAPPVNANTTDESCRCSSIYRDQLTVFSSGEAAAAPGTRECFISWQFFLGPLRCLG